MNPTALALELATLATWRAREDEERDGWRFLAEGGITGRVNAVWPLAWTGPVGVGPAIDAAEAWYAARGLPCVFKIADGCVFPKGLSQELTIRGYAPDTETLVMWRSSADDNDHRVGSIARLLAEISEEDIAGNHTLQNDFAVALSEASSNAAESQERLNVVRRAPFPRTFAVLRRGGAIAAIGMYALAPSGLAGIYAMRTMPAFRRQGLAEVLLDFLIGRAVLNGAKAVFLQVEAANAPAIALYKKTGFATAFAYRYWRKT
jgi:GNAT superfamily N-acetyltransferase